MRFICNSYAPVVCDCMLHLALTLFAYPRLPSCCIYPLHVGLFSRYYTQDKRPTASTGEWSRGAFVSDIVSTFIKTKVKQMIKQCRTSAPPRSDDAGILPVQSIRSSGRRCGDTSSTVAFFLDGPFVSYRLAEGHIIPQVWDLETNTAVLPCDDGLLHVPISFLTLSCMI